MTDVSDIAKETEDKNTAFLCLLCFQPYDNPRELPCFHTFCQRCLDGYTMSKLPSDEMFPCPVCEEPTLERCTKSPVTTWSAFLPHDVAHRPSSAEVQRDDDTAVCEGCKRDGEKSKATHWCRHCTETLCTSCRIAHRRNKKTTAHKIIDINDVSKVGSPTLSPSVRETCPQHPGKTLEVYCIDHHALCCILCLAVSHRECKHMRSVEDVSRGAMATCDHIWVKLDAESKKLLQIDEQALSALELDKENVTLSIETMIDAVRKTLDELQTKFLEDVNIAHDKNRQLLKQHKRNTEQFYTNMKNTRLLMSLTDGHVTPRLAFIARDQASVQLTSHYQRLKHRTLQSQNVYRMEIETDDIVDKMTHAIRAAGDFKVTSTLSDSTRDALSSVGASLESLRKTHTFSSFADSISSSDMIGSLTRGRLIGRKVKPKTEIRSVKSHLLTSVQSKILGGRQAILLTGGAFVEDKWLIMADCNNKRLLLFDEDYNYLKQYAINGCPTDVARGCKPSELYVAVYNKEVLKCSFASGHLDIVGRTSCPTLTCGIDILDGKLVVVTTETVKVLEIDEPEINRAQITTTGATCIGACSQRHLYYHRDDNSVVGRSLNGREVTRYAHPHLRDPVGICSDSFGHVLVCGYQSGNVHEMAPDGTRGRVLVKKLHQIKHPWAVIVHPSGREFVVTSCKETTAFEVYRFIPGK
ncbi:RING finger protein 207-like [Ylistrum balloti]|uniref:RING finger protein 207-like n=1 Tax=Ylistrum balloti TaxID=509963 RepID=UPI002905B822|nr:RING finger protein 207-like [Ylistrum balloti]